MTDAAPDAAAEIDAKIAALGDWRGATLGTLRALIRQAIPDIEESIKWRKPSNPAGVPIWSVVDADGNPRILCTGEVYKDLGHADLHGRRQTARPDRRVQRQPRRRNAAGDRLARGGDGGRGGVCGDGGGNSVNQLRRVSAIVVVKIIGVDRTGRTLESILFE